MNYLAKLAQKLVPTYEDEDNFAEWVTFGDRARNRATIISALLKTMEIEAKAGRLSFSSFRPEFDFDRPARLAADGD